MFKLTLIFTTNHADTLGNACRLEMIRYLSVAFETTILTNQENFIQQVFPNCKIEVLDTIKKSKLPVISDVQYWKSFAEKVNSISCDGVFMFHDDAPSTLWIKYPVFLYVHQYGQRSNQSGNLIKKIAKSIIGQINDNNLIRGMKKSRINFVVSPFIIEILRKRGLTKLELILHGIDIKKYQEPALLKEQEHELLKKLKDEGYFIISYIGWVTENRGFQLMMDSIKTTSKQDNKIVLVIAGADKHFSKRIEDFRSQNNLKENIVNLGVVDFSLISGILHYSDICLSFLDDVPAYRISPPQKVIEYFAAGKPVICNKIEPHEWLVNHGKNGFILNYDAQEVAKAVLKLKNDSVFLKEMSVNALKEASKYDINNVYGNMVKKIEEAINETKV